ncbi:MAG: RNA 3'-terminal phosphate cyclase [Methanoregulaceae archaeon]
MLEVDGSVLEGGGQIVRSAVALSAITGIPVRVRNIRAGRDRPGLRYQHCAAVRSVASVCSARVDGCDVGGDTLTFSPEKIEKRSISVDIGTAGSIPMVLQAWLPVVLDCGGEIVAQGGTEVPLSPTIDYFEHVTGQVIRSHGGNFSTTIVQRGYYPRGGGIVRVVVEPSCMRPISFGGPAEGCGIVSCSSGLPDHVATRQASSAVSLLAGEGIDGVPVEYDRRDGPGTGSSITVWFGCRGACALGRRGVPAELVGSSAARGLVDELYLQGDVDRYLGDQLLIYLARYGGRYSCTEYTLHARTMVWLLEQFGFFVDVREGHPVEFACESGS